jgi:hypothetical protein
MNALKKNRRIESPQAGPIGDISLSRVSEEGRGVATRAAPKSLVTPTIEGSAGATKAQKKGKELKIVVGTEVIESNLEGQRDGIKSYKPRERREFLQFGHHGQRSGGPGRFYQLQQG